MSNPFDEAYVAAKATQERTPEPKKSAKKSETPSASTLVLVSEAGEYDLDDDSYHADPCPEPSLSSSIAKVLINRSPWHAWASHPRLNPDYEPDESARFDLGSAFHKLILGEGRDIAVLDFDSWRTDASKAARAQARAQHLIPMLREQYERALRMERTVRRQIRHHEELAYAMAGGAAERTLVWLEITAHGPVWCRIKLDWQPHGGVLFPDWKSTEVGAGPDEWGTTTMWNMDVDIQAAFYERGIKAVLDRDATVFFAVAEVKAPHALATHRVTPAAGALAAREVERAIQLWGYCVNKNKWPGYRPQMSWQDPPPWKERRKLEREERGDLELDTARLQIEALGDYERPDRAGDDSVDAFGLHPIPENAK
jgi:hypothetical protein